MKLERWFIGLLIAWILSLPWAYLFAFAFAQTLGSKQLAPPLAQNVIDFFGTSPLGAVGLLFMVAGMFVAWFTPFIWVPMFIFFLL